MNFRTKVAIEESDYKIDHHQKISLIGSCFTHNIGNKLKADKLDVSINPFGILFNPMSIANAIKFCVLQGKFEKSQLLNRGEKWLSFKHHSQFNALSANDSLKEINESIEASSDYYNDADFLIVTFGTAWVYTYNETGEIVANCHKIPNNQFTKRLLSIEEIVEEYKKVIIILKDHNPRLKIIFTISPVRHWKDGVVENNRSKAVLHLAISQLVKEMKEVSYFPSYEIVLDELRDYRFYKEDMLHPNQMAVDYIYERFSQAFYTKETTDLIDKIKKVELALSHKPFNPNSESHQKFIELTNKKIRDLRKEYPFIHFEHI
jgi:hypothetical protein